MKNYKPILHDYHIRKHGLVAALRMKDRGWEDWSCPELMETGYTLSAGSEKVMVYGFFSMRKKDIYQPPTEEDIKKAMEWMGCRCRPSDNESRNTELLVCGDILPNEGSIIIAAIRLGIVVERLEPHWPGSRLFISKDTSVFDSIEVMRNIIGK